MTNEEYLESIGFKGGHNRIMNYVKEIDFKKEIAEYGNSLEYDEKEVCREICTDLLNAGYDYDFLYFALFKLGGQDIIQYRYLFFNSKFQKEVAAEVDEYYHDIECKRLYDTYLVEKIREQMKQREERPVLKIVKNKEEKKKFQMHWKEIENSTDE